MDRGEARFRRSGLRLLLDHLSAVGDPREPCKVKYPLCEVLFLVSCASIAGCDDYDEIALWGERHLPFLRGSAEYHFGTPWEDWLDAHREHALPAYGVTGVDRHRGTRAVPPTG